MESEDFLVASFEEGVVDLLREAQHILQVETFDQLRNVHSLHCHFDLSLLGSGASPGLDGVGLSISELCVLCLSLAMLDLGGRAADVGLLLPQSVHFSEVLQLR